MAELISFDNLIQVLEEYGAAIRNEYQDNLIKGNRIASGNLLNSVEFEVVQGDKSFKVNLNLAEYWKYIEEGIAPAGKYGNPGWKAYPFILKWIEIKPVIPRPMDNGRLPSPEQLAYLITRKRMEEGAEGSHDLSKAANAINDQWREKIIEAFTKDVRNTMDGYIIEFFK